VATRLLLSQRLLSRKWHKDLTPRDSVMMRKKLKSIIRYLDSLFISRVNDRSKYLVAAKNKIGLEIGGPSAFFLERLPIYNVAAKVDLVNFNNHTLWESNLKPGERKNYLTRETCHQFIAEATNLGIIQDNSYDFILSCNSLEHIANPFKALIEWRRLLKSRGSLILVVPQKKFNFDHRRPDTSFAHLESDYKENVDENDLTHLPEILALHDLSRDPGAGSMEDFECRSRNNHLYRGLHHHVFNEDVAEKMLMACGFKIVGKSECRGNLVFLAERSIS
jgi:ubiquinone/menaquinone biosynthesis C-methylase UbiE